MKNLEYIIEDKIFIFIKSLRPRNPNSLIYTFGIESYSIKKFLNSEIKIII